MSEAREYSGSIDDADVLDPGFSQPRARVGVGLAGRLARFC